MALINTASGLSDFRNSLTGESVLEMLRRHNSPLLVTLEIGVGKSTNIDDVTEYVAASSEFDLIVILAPTRRIINERRFIKHPPLNIKVVNLKPRPKNICPRSLNHRWSVFERNNLGVLGRTEICGNCPDKGSCYWINQYGKSLEGAKVIFATHSHLEVLSMAIQICTISGH
ncbi:MAG: hypothetical protein HQK96_02550 [Nitrospirae bacterium]|nr:hypothetical protein [Nitrospirota bacterium]